MPTPIPAQLYRPAAIAISLLATGVVVLWLAQAAVDDRRSVLDQTRTTHQHTLDLMERTEHESTAIVHAAARLAALPLQPITERTPHWNESLGPLHGDPRLFGFVVRAEGAARELADVDGLPLIRLQGLRLEIDLLHEEGLTALLHALANADGAIAIPLGCKIERLAPPTIESPASAPGSSTAILRAQCELDWLTLHPRLPPRS